MPIETAAFAVECTTAPNTQCDANSYCGELTMSARQCQPCPTSWPKSTAGATSQDKCYKDCAACTAGTGATCTPTTAGQAHYSDDCSYTCDCKPGYDNKTGGGTNPSCACTVNKFQITYDANGGGGSKSPTTCTYDGTCAAPAANTFNAPAGQIFSNWKCTKEDGGVCSSADNDLSSSGIVAAGGNIKNANVGGTGFGITLTAQWTACTASSGQYCAPDGTIKDCEKGYYCTGGQKAECPGGKTTTGTKSIAATDCKYVAGAAGTQFCDSTGKCFNLPTIN